VVHGLVQVAVPGGMMPRSMWDMAVRIGALEDLPGLAPSKTRSSFADSITRTREPISRAGTE
jgi:hypothetical protein